MMSVSYRVSIGSRWISRQQDAVGHHLDAVSGPTRSVKRTV